MHAELIQWSETEYQDENEGYIFGVEILDEEKFSFDCHWFKTEQERAKFIKKQNLILCNS